MSEEVRERSREMIDRANAALAVPRDPAVVERAAEWARQAEERTAAPSTPPEPHKAAPAPAPAPVAYVSRQWFDGFLVRERERRDKAIERAGILIVDYVAKTFESARTKTTWRFQEAERRIAELEERIARLEGRTDG